MCGPHPREDRRVTRRRCRDRVVLIAVIEHRALVDQLKESAGQLSLPATQVIGSELVHRNHHDQLGSRRRRDHTAQEGETRGESHGSESSGAGASSRMRSVKYPTSKMIPAEMKNGTCWPSFSYALPA